MRFCAWTREAEAKRLKVRMKEVNCILESGLSSFCWTRIEAQV